MWLPDIVNSSTAISCCNLGDRFGAIVDLDTGAAVHSTFLYKALILELLSNRLVLFKPPSAVVCFDIRSQFLTNYT